MESDISKTSNMAMLHCHRTYVAFDGVLDVFYFIYLTLPSFTAAAK